MLTQCSHNAYTGLTLVSQTAHTTLTQHSHNAHKTLTALCEWGEWWPGEWMVEGWVDGRVVCG